MSETACCGWASREAARAGGEATKRYAVAWATYLDVNGCTNDDYECAPLSDPALVIDAFVAAYNSGNMDPLIAFLTEDSVVIDHPFAAKTTGRDELRALMVADRSAAAAEDPYTISNVVVMDNVVTWDHEWISDTGEAWCAAGHEATVDDGRVTMWEFAPDRDLCA